MAESPWRRILDIVRRKADPDATGPLADERLLARFVANGDPSAFELLVWRHGSLVFGTCRRILGDVHAAEDAFQATFLALARKPRSVRTGAALAGWLHRVAVRIANKLRASRSRQATVERHAARSIATFADGESETIQVMDEEIDRLPTRLRRAVVLCYLDGRTTEQAAEILGCPRGTVLSRLSAARDRLRDRLTRRGFSLPVTGISALMFAAESSASLIPVAVRTALTGASPLITGLVQGVFHAMLLTKVKIATAVVLGIGLAGAGVGWVVVPGSGPGVVLAEEGQNQPPAGSTAKGELPNTQDSNVRQVLELLTELKGSLSQKLEQAEQEHLDFRLKNPYTLIRNWNPHTRLIAIETKRTELLLKEADLSVNLERVSKSLEGPNDEKYEQNARTILLKLQLRGIDVNAMRKALSFNGKETSAIELMRTYQDALESEVRELKSQLASLDEIFDREKKQLRELSNYEAQDDRHRNMIKQNRELLDVVIRRLAELNLNRTRKEK